MSSTTVNGEKIIRVAEFSPSVKTYWVLSSTILCFSMIFTIPLLPIWIPVAFIFANRFLSSLSCVLTERSLEVKRGWLFRTEKTVPLDKITDLGLSQGPVMRHLDIEQISVETAGGTSTGALVSLPGIVDAREFRDAVFHQKELLAQSSASTTPTASATASTTDQLLTDIRDSLRRIEEKM